MEKGQIIWLNGVSSSGKSSLMQELQKYFQHHFEGELAIDLGGYCCIIKEIVNPNRADGNTGLFLLLILREVYCEKVR